MKSRKTKSFKKLFERLPSEVKEQARQSYILWSQNRLHPSLHFKKISEQKDLFSVRIGIRYRAIGLLKENVIYWHWIGSHEDYNNLV